MWVNFRAHSTLNTMHGCDRKCSSNIYPNILRKFPKIAEEFKDWVIERCEDFPTKRRSGENSSLSKHGVVDFFTYGNTISWEKKVKLFSWKSLLFKFKSLWEIKRKIWLIITSLGYHAHCDWSIIRSVFLLHDWLPTYLNWKGFSLPQQEKHEIRIKFIETSLSFFRRFMAYFTLHGLSIKREKLETTVCEFWKVGLSFSSSVTAIRVNLLNP